MKANMRPLPTATSADDRMTLVMAMNGAEMTAVASALSAAWLEETTVMVTDIDLSATSRKRQKRQKLSG
jgi:hypothetical protein